MEHTHTRNIIYNDATDSFTVFYDDELTVMNYLLSYGFLDADVLNDKWLAYDRKIYKLEANWRNSLKQYGFFTIEFVGYPYHVIDKGEMTGEKYYFIKRLFDD